MPPAARRDLKADDLTGYQENPDVSTAATGSFTATIDDDAQTITYELSYSGIEGGTASAAHIHFGKRAVNGGVSAFLCSGGDKPACPATAGTVTGVIDAADIIGPAGQGIGPGEFDELVAAMRAGHTYVNVHSTGGTRPGRAARSARRSTTGTTTTSASDRSESRARLRPGSRRFRPGSAAGR